MCWELMKSEIKLIDNWKVHELLFAVSISFVYHNK
jgi:hypothetical protein